MYAVDITFQQSKAPGGSIVEKKLYFSKKHGHYGFKEEVSVLPNGAINITTAPPRSIVICESYIDFHVEKLEKTSNEESMLDAVPLVTDYPTAWAILADKGYQGLHRRARAITPAKKPAGGMLSHAELVQNDNIASDRIIVANIFGRLNTLWSIGGDKYAWKRETYGMFFQACTAPNEPQRLTCLADLQTLRPTAANKIPVLVVDRAERCRNIPQHSDV
ncbi:hypothetical protein B5M09_013094 [Aphanomyces astaci]|nr:hypothetical protein B5M09_013094 [Aphanomyces astaci]